MHSSPSLLNADHFFDLQGFKHSALFRPDQPIWDVFDLIADYIASGQFESDMHMVSEQCYLVQREMIFIGHGTRVEPGAYIEGPCVIGRNCVIRHGAYIRGNVIAGDHCVIGHTTEAKNAIFFNHAKAAHFAYVGDTILGNHVNLGAGVKCANVRFDRKAISITADQVRIDTGRKKLGALVGDHTEVGCNAVLLPGTITEKKCRIHPCTSIGGWIKEK